MNLLILIYYLAVILISFSFSLPKYVTLSCKSGKLHGLQTKTIFNKTYFRFTSIPYAEPPLGSLRFKVSKVLKKWKGMLNATKPSPICSQISTENSSLVIGQEDCLFLNIATPKLKSFKNLLPVMVWIHGGSFKDGSGSFENYSPDYLINEDIVLVSINYRLNAFGFLSIEDNDLGIPGNAGLKDQVLALKWIQMNIQFFGGNPNLVTIFGESNGGASTNLLMLSPITKGLFHRVISQSGVAANLWFFTPRRYEKLLELLGCSNFSNKYDKFNCFNSKTPQEIIIAQENLIKPEDNVIGSATTLGAVYELESNEEAIITKNIEDVVKKGDFNHLPVLNGYNTHEGALMIYAKTRVNLGFNDTELLVPDDLNIKRGTNISKFLGEKIKQFYWGDMELSENNLDPYVQFHTDTAFLYKIYDSTRLLSKTNKKPVYFYNFNYHETLNYTSLDAEQFNKYVEHTFELQYLFHKNYTTCTKIPKSVDTTVKLWANFAKFGDFNMLEYSKRIFPVLDENLINFFRIDDKLDALVYPEHKRMQFWDSIYSEYLNATKK